MLRIPQQPNNLVTELNDLMSAGELNMYLAPTIACGVHYLQSMHDSIEIRNSTELAHACDCFEHLVGSNEAGGIKWVIDCHLLI